MADDANNMRLTADQRRVAEIRALLVEARGNLQAINSKLTTWRNTDMQTGGISPLSQHLMATLPTATYCVAMGINGLLDSVAHLEAEVPAQGAVQRAMPKVIVPGRD